MKNVSIPFLLLLALLIPTLSQAQCNDLFFSEYIEGSSSNKAVEIHNPTANTIDLSDYVVYRNNNGSVVPTDSLFPQGMLPADSVFVFVNPSANAAITAQGDTTHTLTFFNGDDAVWLKKISTGDTLDIIGVIGVDPGAGWTIGTGATNNFTLVRKPTVLSGQLDWAVGVTEWDVFPIDMTDSLGTHTKVACPPPPIADLVITEINYNGPESGTDTTEYIEIQNIGNTAVNLDGYFFSQGVTHTFTANDSIVAGGWFVIAYDSSAFRNTHGINADAVWSSGGLSNGGEDITIIDNLGRTVDSVDYDDGGTWPSGFSTGQPDGGGASIVLCDSTADNNDGSNWSAAASAVAGQIVNGLQVFGNPGAKAPCSLPLSFAILLDSNVTCNGFLNGGASVTILSGNIPYTFSWSNTASTASITGVGAGKYFVTVTDNAGLSGVDSITITEPAQLVSAAVVDSNVTVNGGTNGGASASVTGGTAPYTYLWSNSATTASITGVGSGTYFVTITDANGCFDSSSVVVTQPATIVVTVTNDSNVTCNGSTDGGASVTATGGITPYTYLWSNGATTASITGVGASTYSVTVTDNVGSVANGFVTILEPNLLVATAVVDSNVNVNGGTDGGATVSATGGTVPYTYLWSNSATTTSITGVMAGNYVVTVTDANGCTDTSSVNVTQPAAIMLSGAITNVSCNGGNDGAIDLTVMNGTSPYTYLWSNGETIQDIDTLVAGTYSVTVTDANFSNATATFTITEPTAISVNVVVDSNVSCNGLTDGGLTATATGGTGNLTYQWNAGNRSLAGQSFESTVTDTWAYMASPATYNTEGDSIVNGSDDVWAVIEEFTGDIDTASNGKYFWGIQDIDNGNGGGSFYHTLTFNPINISNETGVKFAFDYYSVGFDSSDSIEYQVQFDNGTTWDSNGVALNKSTQAWTKVTVDVPDTANFIRVRLQAKQNGASDYGAFDNIQLYTGSNSITGVGAGIYTVTVTDSLGCAITANGTITEPTALTASLIAIDATTVGGTDGSVSATVGGGTPTYSYLWSNGSTTANNTGLAAGTYLLTVTDANGCTLVDSAVVADPALVVLTMDSTNISCFGAADGTAKVLASGGSGGYSYAWSNMATTDSIGGLVPGTYTVTVTDFSGTTAIDSVMIFEPTALQLSFAVTNASSTGATNGAIDLTVNGGTPNFTYNWSNAATTEDLTLLGAGTYVVTVTDANGCQITDSATVLEPGTLASLVVTEINYNGPESGTDTSEFIEFTNAGSSTVSLNGYFFSQGVSHTFTSDDSIAAGQYYVIAYDSASFRNRYGMDADAVWTSGGLSNGGEDIIIVDNFGRGVDTVDFDDSAPWPVNSATLGPDGNGASIELQTALNSDNNDGANWVASALAVPGAVVNGFQVFGSPGNPNTTGVSITQVDEKILKVYPNPSRGMITIERENDNVERIQIISIDGKVLNDTQSTQKSIIMDISQFSNGVYFLKVGSETQRIVLTR